MIRLTGIYTEYQSEAYKYTTKIITKIISGFLLLACFYRWLRYWRLFYIKMEIERHLKSKTENWSQP